MRRGSYSAVNPERRDALCLKDASRSRASAGASKPATSYATPASSPSSRAALLNLSISSPSAGSGPHGPPACGPDRFLNSVTVHSRKFSRPSASASRWDSAPLDTRELRSHVRYRSLSTTFWTTTTVSGTSTSYKTKAPATLFFQKSRSKKPGHQTAGPSTEPAPIATPIPRPMANTNAGCTTSAARSVRARNGRAAARFARRLGTSATPFGRRPPPKSLAPTSPLLPAFLPRGENPRTA